MKWSSVSLIKLFLNKYDGPEDLPKLINFFFFFSFSSYCDYFELKINGNKSEGVLSVSLGSKICTDSCMTYCLMIFMPKKNEYARFSMEY